MNVLSMIVRAMDFCRKPDSQQVLVRLVLEAFWLSCAKMDLHANNFSPKIGNC